MESCSSETLSAFSEWIWKLNMNTCISRYSCSIVTSEDLCPGFDWTDPVTVQDCKTSTWLWASFLYTKNVTLCNWVDFFFFFLGEKVFFFIPECHWNHSSVILKGFVICIDEPADNYHQTVQFQFPGSSFSSLSVWLYCSGSHSQPSQDCFHSYVQLFPVKTNQTV